MVRLKAVAFANQLPLIFKRYGRAKLAFFIRFIVDLPKRIFCRVSTTLHKYLHINA
jgi:hypothetical protein